MSGGNETHDTFWKGRELEILLVPACKKKNDIVWTKANVESWHEYNMGPVSAYMLKYPHYTFILKTNHAHMFIVGGPMCKMEIDSKCYPYKSWYWILRMSP